MRACSSTLSGPAGVTAQELKELLDDFRKNLINDLRGAAQSQSVVKPPKVEEKPEQPRSNLACVGLWLLAPAAVER